MQKQEEQTSVKGMVVINDLKGVSTSHITFLNMSIMKKLMTMVEVRCL